MNIFSNYILNKYVAIDDRDLSLCLSLSLSILKSFYNDSKIPLIPPLLVNNKIVSCFTEKANLFNDFLATQCTPLSDSTVLPSPISFKDYLLLILKKKIF